MSTRYLNINFMNKSLSVFSINKEIVKSKERKFLKAEAPYVDKLSGLAIIKLLDQNTFYTLAMKVKFEEDIPTL